MPLEQCLKNGWLKAHQPTRQEIAGLLAIVERDLSDARVASISDDWKFGIAYNAALKLCAVLLQAEKNLNHYRTIHAMGEVFPERKADVHYLDACRAHPQCGKMPHLHCRTTGNRDTGTPLAHGCRRPDGRRLRPP